MTKHDVSCTQPACTAEQFCHEICVFCLLNFSFLFTKMPHSPGRTMRLFSKQRITTSHFNGTTLALTFLHHCSDRLMDPFKI